MQKILIIFGSTTGMTEMASEQVEETLTQAGYQVERKNVVESIIDDLNDFEIIFFGVSTWDYGCLQYDFEPFHDDMQTYDFTSKKCAVFGTGDKSYGDTYCEAVRTIASTIQRQGGTLILPNLEIESDMTPERMKMISDWAKGLTIGGLAG